MRPDLNIEGLSHRDVLRLRLWDSEINTEGICLLNMEHLEARVIGSDQVAHIHVADRDGTGEGCGHPFEGDFLFKKPKIGGKRLGIGLVRALRGGHILRIELGDNTLFV